VVQQHHQLGGGCTITVTNEYTGDPAFAADGYHLTAGSAAIDRGVDVGVDDDIDGDPRPLGTDYDLGADEFTAAPAPPVPLIYLPVIFKNSN
jgi:hypothetical protein